MYEATHNLAAVWGIVSFFGWGGIPPPKKMLEQTLVRVYTCMVFCRFLNNFVSRSAFRYLLPYPHFNGLDSMEMQCKTNDYCILGISVLVSFLALA